MKLIQILLLSLIALLSINCGDANEAIVTGKSAGLDANSLDSESGDDDDGDDDDSNDDDDEIAASCADPALVQSVTMDVELNQNGDITCFDDGTIGITEDFEPADRIDESDVEEALGIQDDIEICSAQILAPAVSQIEDGDGCDEDPVVSATIEYVLKAEDDDDDEDDDSDDDEDDDLDDDDSVDDEDDDDSDDDLDD